MKSVSLMCLILGGLRHRRPAPHREDRERDQNPPAIWSHDSGSERRMTASTAATKGWRFAASVALFAPIRWIDRNQRTLVSTEADRREDHQQPDLPSEIPVLLQVWASPAESDRGPCSRDDDRARPATASTSHQGRDDDRVRGPGRRRRGGRAGSRRDCWWSRRPNPRRPAPLRRRTRARRPRSAGRTLPAEREPEAGEDRDRAEDETDRRRRRDVEREDERDWFSQSGPRPAR